MIKITVNDLIEKFDCKLLVGFLSDEIKECTFNSKTKTENGTFFGIKGEKTDGSLYYKEALDNGAKVCILSKVKEFDSEIYKDKTILIASNPLSVLQNLAKYKRSLFKGTVIGVTGSIGKTSTKEFISSVLEEKYKVLKTIGNQNSQIGLPLTIMRLQDEDVMVLEMGMNNKGELHNLSLIAKPDISVITNVYSSHIGNLGSRENILKAKLEITDGMSDGLLLINNDNDMLKKVSYEKIDQVKTITYGIENESSYMATNLREDDLTYFDIEDEKDFCVVGGKPFIYNAMVSFIIGSLMNVEKDVIKKKINNIKKVKHRLEKIVLDNNVTLIDDSYNASYESIKAALNYISKFKNRKVAVLGDVLELGPQSKKIHEEIGKLVIDYNIDYLITIGKDSKYINKIARKLGMKRKNMKHFKDEKSSRKFIEKLLIKDDIVLIKGSNGIGLINLIEYLKKD